MARRAENSAKSSNNVSLIGGGVRIYVSGVNNFDWLLAFKGHLADFLKNKAKQFSNKNPSFNNKNYHDGVYLEINFDKENKRFFGIANNDINTKCYLGNKRN